MPLKGLWGGAGRDTYENPNKCSKCDSTNCEVTDRSGGFDTWRCKNCNNEWLTPQ